jgi:iron complex transport system substrate-binding protein
MLHLVRTASLLVSAVLVAGACGATADPDSEGRPLAEPVTVEHRFGSTTIEKVPERIVTIDLQWTDTMLAMGVEPVGYSVDSLMPDGKVPWQKLPSGAKALALDDGLPVEEIIALDPDLILASFSITDQETYDVLAARAPTIAGPPSADQVTPWQDLVRTAGEFLDDSATAEKVVSDVEGSITATGAELPGLAGRTFLLAQYVVGDGITLVADEKDGSSLFFGGLGMTLFPPAVAEGQRTGATRAQVSTERADLLAADLLVFLVNGGDESDLADIPGFEALPGTVAIADYPTVVGLNTPSPLSLPYSLEQLRPDLEAAAGT